MEAVLRQGETEKVPVWEVCGSRRLELSGVPRIMGVLNVTPDSFFDGGCYSRPGPALEQAGQMVEQGADIIDVGGESTRPGAGAVEVKEEIDRVVPVVSEIVGRLPGVLISVDTYKAEVARRAVEAGAAIVNDVGAGLLDPGMFSAVAELGVGLVMMHMRGSPRSMQRDTHYDDLMAELREFFAGRLEQAEKAGIPLERIVLDPGVGFGKSAQDNYRLIAGLGELSHLGRPVLVGPSRKSFMALAGLKNPEERLEGTLAACTVATLAGAAILRVHDIGPVARAVAVAARFRPYV